VSTPWQILGLPGEPTRIEDIHAAYESRKETLTQAGDLMGQLSLEDAYLNALALWEKDDDYCEKAVKTDLIFDDMAAEHAKSEPLSVTELQEIATHIMRTLHNPWQRNSIATWMSIFEIDPIDCPDDRQFEDILREALLRYFGYYDDKHGFNNKSGGPRFMQPKIAKYIFAKARWVGRRTSSEKERRELSWLRQELDVGASSDEVADAGMKDFYIVVSVVIVVLFLAFQIIGWVRS